ncbi:hypothetical protein KEH51_14410 [[Brevibacterium] frigoritolerans]|uniref:Uncharacterized protein n=1 Tax=Peribacillus frigoritolerans TaxID=450367 RepID=A0A941J7U4_9BACI|nr:hypothetical protein [Peribacillus frigoritolerans]
MNWGFLRVNTVLAERIHLTYKLKIIPSELSRPTITKWYGPLDVDIAKDIDDKVNLLKEELGIDIDSQKGNHPNSKEFIKTQGDPRILWHSL